jgi:hypothetical protein
MTKAVRVTSIARAIACACAAFVMMGAGAAHARVAAHLEGGFGQSVARPLEAQVQFGVLGVLSASLPLCAPVRGGVEVAASLGGHGLIPSIGIPERAEGGRRSLTTFLATLETCPIDARGAFASLGAGVGHSTLSGARRSMERHLGEEVAVPPRDRLSFAFGLGLGYRTRCGPYALGWQVALRHHATVHAGQTDASTTALTLGLVY